LDLDEGEVIDIGGVHWLNARQHQDVKVENCAPYIRKWMLQEKLGKEK